MGREAMNKQKSIVVEALTAFKNWIAEMGSIDDMNGNVEGQIDKAIRIAEIESRIVDCAAKLKQSMGDPIAKKDCEDWLFAALAEHTEAVK
jgi:hypothetical protein